MPFMGRDWRAPGEKWVKTPHTNGWERTKLRPIQIPSDAIAIPGKSAPTEEEFSGGSLDEGRGTSSDDSVSEDDHWVPHCFVKSKSKEFIGCTSMSEAFHRLDLARAVCDIRRFNYVCKVVSILVEQKLRNLSATARKSLLSIVTAIVLRAYEADMHVSTARELLNTFSDGLDGHMCGSPQLAARHQLAVGSLLEAVSSARPRALAESDETATTFLDLPKEVLSLVLRRLPDERSLLESAKAHAALEAIVANEDRLWHRLCLFHFTEVQMRTKAESVTWRDTFFTLKKYHGLKEVYADLVHICCQCKALFWKSLGHPCVRPGAPSVRVTPQQFVDMLLFL